MFIDEKEIAAKKAEHIRIKESVDKQLRGEGISPLIANNPRYQSILSRIAYMVMHNGSREDFTTKVDSDGNVLLMHTSQGKPEVCMKYYIDKSDGILKRAKIEFNEIGEEKIKTISSYDSDGIETCLLLDQAIDYNEIYLTRTTRLENNPHIIKIERIEQIGKEKKRLPDIYQARVFFAALEDIEPDAKDIDPFDIMFFELYGIPRIYRDISPLEDEIIRSELPLGYLGYREEQFKTYKKSNATFHRTTVFEDAIADMLEVDSRTIDDDE